MKLTFRFLLASREQVGAAKLIMPVGGLRIELGGSLKLSRGLVKVALLQKCLPEAVTRRTIIRALPDDLPQQSQTVVERRSRNSVTAKWYRERGSAGRLTSSAWNSRAASPSLASWKAMTSHPYCYLEAPARVALTGGDDAD